MSFICRKSDISALNFQEELERRKRVMQAYDQQRKKNEPLDDIDQEAKEEAQYLLKRANELRQEQEDEVKHLNEVRYFCFSEFISHSLFSWF